MGFSHFKVEMPVRYPNGKVRLADGVREESWNQDIVLEIAST